MANKGFHQKGRDLPGFFLVTDQDRRPDPGPLLSRLCRGDGVILRHRDPGTLEKLFQRLAPMARRRGLVVILATEPKTAAGLGADGCHLSEVALRRQAGKRRRPWPGFLITAATHGPSALNKAALLGCDAALLSPIFPTLSHPDAQTLGPLKTRLWVRRVGFPLPVFALGGLRPATAKRLGRQALSGFAATEPFEGKGLRKSVPHR